MKTKKNTFYIIILSLFITSCKSLDKKYSVKEIITYNFIKQTNLNYYKTIPTIMKASLGEISRTYYIRKDTTALPPKDYHNLQNVAYFHRQYIGCLNYVINHEDIFYDLVTNSDSDTLNIMLSFADNDNTNGIVYWEGNNMNLVYYINFLDTKDYKRKNRKQIVPSQKLPNHIALKHFFNHYRGKDSFSEWIIDSREKGIYGLSDTYLYSKMLLSKDKKTFEFLDFAFFLN